ncbi:type I 3-dehydroquinate dehydratase [Bacillus sp. Bva_UNVM-123]|uniref:type I 3-dehydroquinate dehydratase n=1 Tax=Bacillus sp. Bva_UNVM-123 TaxID=2829798 RepID=UPI00391EF6B9
MKKTIKIKNIVIGEGAPKICVPMVGRTLAELLEEAAYLQTIDLDMVEWRVDFFEHVEDIEKVKVTLKEIRKRLRDVPLIFTLRSAKEGGEINVSSQYYVALNKAIAETGEVDVIDVELFNDEQDIKVLVEIAHIHNLFVIISNHDFEKTPAKEEIISRLRKAQELGSDLPKMAVMPTTTTDLLTLLDATATMAEKFADRPIITMSMASKGIVSRIAGEVFGSSITFGAAKKASAPGQVDVQELREILNILHKHL